MYSWNEIEIYDVPAMIDYIIERTGQEKIFMIQHSQGTAFFVMASERPEYQEKMIAAFFLALKKNSYFGLVVSYVGENYVCASKTNFNITNIC